jgi:hypothetical protein
VFVLLRSAPCVVPPVLLSGFLYSSAGSLSFLSFPLLVCWFSWFSSIFLLSPLFWSSIVVLLWRTQVLVQLLLKMETWHNRSAGPKEGSLLL